MSAADTEMPELQRLADRVVALVQAEPRNLGHDLEANVRAARVRHGLTRFANSIVHQHVGEDTVAVSLTLALDSRTTSATTTRTDEAALAALVTAAVDAAALQPPDPHWPGASGAQDAVGVLGMADEGTAGAGAADRVALVRDFVAAGEGLEAAGYVDTELQQVAFASTAGRRVAAQATRATVDGIQRTATSAGGAHATAAAVRDLDATAAGGLATDRARRSRDAVEVAPGTYEVVLGPEAVATILTFLAFYGFNAKHVLEGGSFVRLGEQQFDPALHLYDDATDPRSVGLRIDAEGTVRRRTTLIDAGVSAALTHDLRTARRAGSVSTGNALPGGEAFGPMATDLVLVPGQASPASMVAGVARGLFVTQFHYVRVLDPKTSVTTGLTRNGTFLIEDGELTGAVGNLRFTQGLVSALAPGRVLAVGDDDRYADAEFGPGMVICPSLHLAGWQFTGGADG